jgi:hypothetical protein
MSATDGFTVRTSQCDGNSVFEYRLQRGPLVLPRAADISEGFGCCGDSLRRFLDTLRPDFLPGQK